MSVGQECKYATVPDETRHTALRRKNVELENQLQEIRSSQQNLQQFVEALKSVDDNAAASIVRQLRNGSSVSELAQDVSTDNLLLQLSDRPSLARRKRRRRTL